MALSSKTFKQWESQMLLYASHAATVSTNPILFQTRFVEQTPLSWLEGQLYKVRGQAWR